MKRAPVKASKSHSQAGRVKAASVRISSGSARVTGKASVKTK